MAGRTVSRFNETATKDGRGTVVTWCASCHMHMSDIMAPGNTVAFDITHISELLVASIDRLAPLLTVPVPRRVLLHRHLGFLTHVPINDRVTSVLSRIQGLELIEGPALPGHMCSGIATVPGALKAVIGETWSAAIANRADTVCTIFHPCHREFAALDLTVATTSGSGTGFSSLPKQWVSKSATPTLAGAMAPRPISPPSSAPSRRAIRR